MTTSNKSYELDSTIDDLRQVLLNLYDTRLDSIDNLLVMDKIQKCHDEVLKVILNITEIKSSF